MHLLAHEVGDLGEFEHAQVSGRGDVVEHSGRAVDAVLKQGRVDRFLCSVDRAVVARTVPERHQRVSAAAHHLLDVVEVEVDLAGDREDIGDAANGLAQHIVSPVKRLRDREAAVVLVDEALVGDHDHGVGDVVQAVDPVSGGVGPRNAFELEGASDHGDRQRARLASHLGHDRGCSGARTTAHAGRDEGHVDIGEEVANLVAAVLRGARAALRVAANAQAVRLGVGNTDDRLRLGAGELLVVGIDRDEFDPANLVGDHPVDGIATAAADSDNGDRRDALVAAALVSSAHLRIPLCRQAVLGLAGSLLLVSCRTRLVGAGGLRPHIGRSASAGAMSSD